jgi:hypothetical protein
MVATGVSGIQAVRLFVFIFSGTFGLIGLVFLVVGLSFSAAYKRKQSLCTGYAEGTVSAFQGSNTSTSVRLVYTFSIDGKQMQYLSSYASNAPGMLVGQTVHIHYDPQNVGNVYVEEETRQQGVFIRVFTILGGVFLTVALIVAAVLLGIAG